MRSFTKIILIMVFFLFPLVSSAFFGEVKNFFVDVYCSFGETFSLNLCQKDIAIEYGEIKKPKVNYVSNTSSEVKTETNIYVPKKEVTYVYSTEQEKIIGGLTNQELEYRLELFRQSLNVPVQTKIIREVSNSSSNSNSNSSSEYISEIVRTHLRAAYDQLSERISDVLDTESFPLLSGVGALSSGSIVNGFGNIDIGTNSLTAGVANFASTTVTSLTVTGDLTVTGAQTLSGALGAAYFNATDPNATSTFAGNIVANSFYGNGSSLTGIPSLFSNTVAGLTYNNSTGITSLTSGYNIPLTASTTARDSNILTLQNSSIFQNGNSFGSIMNIGTNDNNPLNFKTNNTTALTILENGNVGIGTANPSEKLFINGNMRLAPDGVLTLENATGYNPTGERLRILLGNPYTGQELKSLVIYGDGRILSTGGLTISQGSGVESSSYSFGGGWGRIAFNSSHIQGNEFTSAYGISLVPSGGYPVAVTNGTTAQTFEVTNTRTSATSFEALRLKAVAGANYQIGSAIGSAGGTNRGLSLGNWNAGGTFSEALSIGTTGNVGIGTTNPTSKLDVEGTITGTNLALDNYQWIYWGGSALISGGPGYVTLNNVTLGGITTLTVVNANISGNVGIGTTNPQQKLHVYRSDDGAPVRFEDSNGYCEIDPTSTTWTCTSDRSLKDNITSIDNSVIFEKMLNLEPVTFTWKTDSSNTTRTGFIAQDVELVFPEFVTTDSTTGLKSVAYGAFVPYIVSSIQELNGKIQQMIAWFESGKFKVQGDVCVDDVCITKEQFKDLISGRGVNVINNNPSDPVPVGDSNDAI